MLQWMSTQLIEPLFATLHSAFVVYSIPLHHPSFALHDDMSQSHVQVKNFGCFALGLLKRLGWICSLAMSLASHQFFGYYHFFFLDFKEQAQVHKQATQCLATRSTEIKKRYYMDFGFIHSSHSNYTHPNKSKTVSYSLGIGIPCISLLWIKPRATHGYS